MSLAPALVRANGDNPIAVYPGGVFAVRAKEFIGPARGSLSSEADSLASSGYAVRDTQKVASYSAASDTLRIPMSSLPLRDIPYMIFASSRVEGDWDTSNSATWSSNYAFTSGNRPQLGFHQTSGTPNSGNPADNLQAPHRFRPHYILQCFGAPGPPSIFPPYNANNTIFFRAYTTATGSTEEWLIDQLIFVPWVDGDVSSEYGDNYIAYDFLLIPGIYDLYNAPIIDGDDGGDDNGKYTLNHENLFQTNPDIIGNEGGGDYQVKSSYASAEYSNRNVVDDVQFWGDDFYPHNTTYGFDPVSSLYA